MAVTHRKQQSISNPESANMLRRRNGGVGELREKKYQVMSILSMGTPREWKAIQEGVDRRNAPH